MDIKYAITGNYTKYLMKFQNPSMNFGGNKGRCFFFTNIKASPLAYMLNVTIELI